MLNIFKLRVRLFKNDYKIVLLMMGLSLVFTFVFGSAGSQQVQMPMGLAISQNSDFSPMAYLAESQPETYILYESEALMLAVEKEEVLLGAIANGQVITLVKKSERAEIIQQEIQFKNDLRSANRELGLIQAITPLVGDLEDSQTRFVNEKKYNDSFQLNKRFFGVSKWADVDNVLQGLLGFTLYFSTFSMVFGMGDIVEDKRLFTWHRLLTTPTPLSHIITGNLLFYSVMGLLQIMMIFILGQTLFDVAFNGQLPLVILITGLYVITMNGLGLLIASLMKDSHQLSAVSPIVLTVMAMLGGCMWPLEMVTSKFLIALSYLTPHRWALSAIKQVVLLGGPTTQVMISIGVLITMATLLIGLGWYSLYKKPVL